MNESFPIIVVFAGLCVVTGLGLVVGGAATRDSSTPATAGMRPTPAAPEIKQTGREPQNTRELSQMQTWWNLTQSQRIRHPQRKPANPPMSLSQQTWAPTVPMPETPRYLRDASRWPLHGPGESPVGR